VSDMTYRRLGRSGLHVLTVGLGCNNEPVRAASVTAGDAFDRVEALRVVAEARDLSLVELAIGWLAGQPTVGSVVAAASSPGQVRADAATAGVVIDDKPRAAVDEAAPGPR
jgi:aryl-alcohol dehydrogenase-like predicted oxidoreductase